MDKIIAIGTSEMSKLEKEEIIIIQRRDFEKDEACNKFGVKIYKQDFYPLFVV